jgi:hypothetical protein
MHGTCGGFCCAADHRLIRFVATISDRAGGIASLAKVVRDAGASFKEIHHERAWQQQDIFAVQVRFTAFPALCAVRCALCNRVVKFSAAAAGALLCRDYGAGTR